MIKIARQCETFSGAKRPRRRPLFDERRVEDGGTESDETEQAGDGPPGNDGNFFFLMKAEAQK